MYIAKLILFIQLSDKTLKTCCMAPYFVSWFAYGWKAENIETMNNNRLIERKKKKQSLEIWYEQTKKIAKLN